VRGATAWSSGRTAAYTPLDTTPEQRSLSEWDQQ